MDTKMQVVGYARFSSDNQRQESIDAQVRAISDFCLKNNLDLIKVYKDEALSGTTDDRKAFQQMIQDGKYKTFSAVVVHKLDRFARNRYDSSYYKRQLKLNDIKVLSVLENIDDSPESIIMESVLEGMAEYYSANLSREVKKGQKENALKCISNGGIPPLGFEIEQNGKLAINEKEAQVVKSIFAQYASGSSVQSICDRINNEGHKTKLGNRFVKTSIYGILRNEKYIGVYSYSKIKKVKSAHGYRHIKNITENTIITKDAIPAIIDESLWNICQSRIRQTTYVPKKQSRVYLLSGKIKCADCGSAYVGNGSTIRTNPYTGKKKEACSYVCVGKKTKKNCSNKNISKPLIEGKIKKLICDIVLSESNIRKIAEEYAERVNTLFENNILEKESIEQTLTQYERQSEKLLNLLLEEIIDNKTYQSKMSEIDEKTTRCKNRLAALNNTQRVTNGEIVQALNVQKAALLEEQPNEELLKKLIYLYVKEISLGQNEMQVDINIPLTIDNRQGYRCGKRTISMKRYSRRTKSMILSLANSSPATRFIIGSSPVIGTLLI